LQNNPGTPKIMVAPPGSTLIQQAKVMASPAMPKIQIQPGPGLGAAQTIQIQPASGVGGQPLFSLTVNQPHLQQGVKRKASDMDIGDQ
jgi:hypothetical protein